MLVKSDPTPLIRPNFHGPLMVILTGYFPKSLDQFRNVGNGMVLGTSVKSQLVKKLLVDQDAASIEST